MKIKVKVSITPLAVHEVAINQKKVDLKDGKGSFTVDADTETTLEWRVRDAPLTKYKIELDPEQGKVVMDGDAPHPIELKIPEHSNAGFGNRNFQIKLEKAR